MYYKLALFGNPVAHSFSPFIQGEFARQFDVQITYDKYCVPPGRFKDCSDKFILAGGFGANVTLPCKEEAFKICTRLSPRARAAGAVNTLKRLDKQNWYGDNTDGTGLVQDLTVAGFRVKNSRILIIGAGGAARGIIPPLAAQMPAAFTITNRTLSKAESLAYEFKISPLPFDRLPERSYDLIINATSAGINQESLDLDMQIFKKCTLVYDMVYGTQAAFFCTAAKTAGANTVRDGLGMLVYQAAASFSLWTRLTPDADTVLTSLRRQISTRNNEH